MEQRGLPPSRLQEVIKKEEWTLSPASSPRLKPARLRGGELEGLNLGKEFERLRDEAQHFPLAPSRDGGGEGGEVKEAEGEREQEDQSSEFLAEGSVSKTTYPHTTAAALQFTYPCAAAV